MEVLYSRCAGLDVHKDTVVACVRVASEGKVSREMRTFDTTTAGLVALSSWLAESGCTHVAMEATLEAGLAHPGRGRLRVDPGERGACEERTGSQDRHRRRGLARGSVGPWPDPRELRPGAGAAGNPHALAHPEAARPREDRPCPAAPENAGGRQHQAGLTDVIGVSGRAMIEALIAGESDPAALARLAPRRLKASPGKLSEALRGRVTPHHRF